MNSLNDFKSRIELIKFSGTANPMMDQKPVETEIKKLNDDARRIELMKNALLSNSLS